MNRNNINKGLALGIAGWLMAALPAHAVCPVCTVAIGAGLGLSRWLGISDAVSGVWVGAFLFSASMWTINWLNGKKISAKWVIPATFAFYYGLTIAPLYLSGVMGHPFNKIFGMDRLLFGTIVGSMVFMAAAWIYEIIKKKNGGKPWFPFQKVAMPLIFTFVASLVIYFADK